jgi:hypothetical protein
MLSFVFAALLALGSSRAVTAAGAAEGAHVKVHAILVIASPQRGTPDPKLAAYEPTLRRILRFEGYHLAGEGTANLTVPGKASVSLARGHALELEAEKSSAQGVHLLVRWMDGTRSLMNTGLTLRPGVPAVLGGPSTGKEGEVWAIILIAD